MFGKKYVRDLINRSAENPADRRLFLRTATAAGLGMLGASVAGSAFMAAPGSAQDA
jgi:hypothetical protein